MKYALKIKFAHSGFLRQITHTNRFSQMLAQEGGGFLDGRLMTRYCDRMQNLKL